MSIYQHSRRPSWMIALGFFLYDRLVGKGFLPKATRLNAGELLRRDPSLNSIGLQGCFELSDGQMDDYALGLWVAEQAKNEGIKIADHTEVETVTGDGRVATLSGRYHQHDRLINIADPWAQKLLRQSGTEAPYQLDLVRGNHLIFDHSCQQAYLFQSPRDRRIFFVLPWSGNTMLGTTEARQCLDDPIRCSEQELNNMTSAWSHYFPNTNPTVVETFAGLRPLLRSAQDPSKASREYGIHRTGNLVTVFGGRCTTALALANKVTRTIH